jgi:hypothetical protein
VSNLREFNFTFTDSRKRTARHRVRIFACDNWTTVVATDRSEQFHCSSVTNSIENLVNALITHAELDTDRLIVIEHYDDLEKETFDLVKFDRMRDGTLHYPSWKAITKAEAEQWSGSQFNWEESHATA